MRATDESDASQPGVDRDPSPGRPANPRADRWLSAILFVVFVVMTVTAWQYPAPAGTLPLLVGAVGSVLTAVLVARAFGSRHEDREAVPAGSQRGRIAMFLWFGAAILCVIVAGILAGAPLFVAAFLRLRERQPWSYAVLAAIPVPLVLYVVVERSFGLYLFRGLFWE
jgi:hypothetical protein